MPPEDYNKWEYDIVSPEIQARMFKITYWKPIKMSAEIIDLNEWKRNRGNNAF